MKKDFTVQLTYNEILLLLDGIDNEIEALNCRVEDDIQNGDSHDLERANRYIKDYTRIKKNLMAVKSEE